MSELALREPYQAPVLHEPPPLTASEIRAQVNLVQEVMSAVMKENEHYGKVPGCGDKPTLLQPGAQKLILTFRLVPDPEIEVLDMPRGHREYRIKMKLYAHNGRFLGAGVGNCSTMESKYRYRTGPVEFTEKPVPKEYWDVRNSDPAKAKALLGGHVAKKDENGRWVLAKQGEKVEHDNPADYYNTCEKMAYKRALVSATLTVTGASDIFTQDIEEFEEGMASAKPSQPAQKPPQHAASPESITSVPPASDPPGTQRDAAPSPPPEDPADPMHPDNLVHDFRRRIQGALTVAEATGQYNQAADLGCFLKSHLDGLKLALDQRIKELGKKK
jgi:hypothetical protein